MGSDPNNLYFRNFIMYKLLLIINLIDNKLDMIKYDE